MKQVEDLTDEQLLRLHDWIMTPTPRERWRAFWRVYRVLRRDGVLAEGSIARAADVALHGLEGRWWRQMRAIDSFTDWLAAPRFLRSHRTRTRRRRRAGRPAEEKP